MLIHLCDSQHIVTCGISWRFIKGAEHFQPALLARERARYRCSQPGQDQLGSVVQPRCSNSMPPTRGRSRRGWYPSAGLHLCAAVVL